MELTTSAFGVTHEVSKSYSMGTAEADHIEAHAAGKHAGNASRHCPKCNGGWVSGGQKAAKLARKVG